MELGALSPLPGTDRGNLLNQVSWCLNELENIRSGTPIDILSKYQDWSNQAVRVLTGHVTVESIEALICSRRYWALQSWPGNGNQGQVYSYIEIEVQERKKVLMEARNALVALEREWKDSTKVLVVADTNVYLHQPNEVWDVDWNSLVRSEDVRLLVPIVVAREIDKGKRSTANVGGKGTQPVRTRSRLTTKRLNHLLENPNLPAKVRDGLEIELIFDRQGHAALVQSDEEIVDRAVAVMALTGQDVRLATRDMTMQLMARRAGLTVVRTDVGEEDDA